MKKIWLLPGLIVALALLIWFFRPGAQNEITAKTKSVLSATTVDPEPVAGTAKLQATQVPPKIPTASTSAAKSAADTQTKPIIELTEGNFESFVSKCFQGEACRLIEDPWKLYQDFKLSGNAKANDNLIAFLRKNLKDPSFRESYKDTLKKMIDDFYPPGERQFQDAAYYNYLGDLQTSLDLYLDLERKSALDSTLRPAPKLNIANTFYDLARYQEALPYYEAALQDYLSGRQKTGIPSNNEMIHFIDARIEETRKASLH